MPCPTCAHAMQAVIHPAAVGQIGAAIIYWCPRCGTLKVGPTTHTPQLVDRCRAFQGKLVRPPIGQTGANVFDKLQTTWHKLGIAECFNRPWKE